MSRDTSDTSSVEDVDLDGVDSLDGIDDADAPRGAVRARGSRRRRSSVDDPDAGGDDITSDADAVDDDDNGADDNGADDNGADDNDNEVSPAVAAARRRNSATIHDHGGPVHHYQPGDYIPIATGGSAHKLASSNIAPLVAAARWNYTVTGDHPDLKRATQAFLLPDRRRKQGKAFHAELDTGGVLVMPWYSPSSIIGAATQKDGYPRPAAVQYRPEQPRLDLDGKEVKYEFLAESDQVIGVHPATPVEKLSADTPLLVAEGQLKADSALTAMLLAAGVDPDDLLIGRDDLYRDGATVEPFNLHVGCRERLHRIISDLPDDKVWLVAEIAGVWNWRNAGMDMGAFSWRRDVYLGFDADITTNPQVHQAATRLWDELQRRHARMHLVTPDGEDAAGNKLGIDDYLSQAGTWDDLLGCVAETLPAPPPSNGLDQVGQVRCSDDMTHLEECHPRMAPDGRTVVGGEWVPTGVELAGRISSVTVSRQASPGEVSSGVFNPRLNETASESTTIELEIGWSDPLNGSVQTGLVTGPKEVLSTPPNMWHRIEGVNVELPILEHPQWPPTGKDAEVFMRCVKSFRRPDVARRVAWTQHGWVPTQDGEVPSFVIGNQVITDPGSEDKVTTAVTEKTLTEVSLYGVGTPDPRPFDDPEYQVELRGKVMRVLDGYVLNRPWAQESTTAAVLAAAYRPFMPVKTNTTVFIHGAKGAGKSFTAAAIYAPLSAGPDCWHEKHLPGSAKDTFAAAELRMHQTVSDVLDDLAPSSNANKASSESGTVEDLIRSVFNGRGKSRSSADGTARKVRNPNCMLIVTAENQVQTASIRERAVTLTIGRGALNPSREPTDALVSLYRDECVPADVAQGLVKFLRWQGRRGWSEMVQTLQLQKAEAQTRAQKVLRDRGANDGEATRASQVAADLLVTFYKMAEFCEELGLDERYMELFDADRLPAGLIDVVSAGFESNVESSPGHMLLTAISSALKSGKAYLRNGMDVAGGMATVAPGRNVGESQMLGWRMSNDQLQSSGSSIGWYLVNEVDGREHRFVLLDKTSTWAVVQREFGWLLGGGMTADASWSNLYDSNFACVDVPRMKRGSVLRTESRVRVPASGARSSGVAIDVQVLLDARLVDEDSFEDAVSGDVVPGDVVSGDAVSMPGAGGDSWVTSAPGVSADVAAADVVMDVLGGVVVDDTPGW